MERLFLSIVIVGLGVALVRCGKDPEPVPVPPGPTPDKTFNMSFEHLDVKGTISGNSPITIEAAKAVISAEVKKIEP